MCSFINFYVASHILIFLNVMWQPLLTPFQKLETFCYYFISSIQNKLLLLTYHDSTIILRNRFIPIFDVEAFFFENHEFE